MKLRYALIPVVLAMAFFYHSVKNYAELPEIHKSRITGECEKMVDYNGNESPCPTTLPAKYHLVWVY